jgi:probable F420-dependent oxidoreductase
MVTLAENKIALGPVGVFGVAPSTPEFAVDIENLGYSSLWLGNVSLADIAAIEPLLDATENLVLATGIVNVWKIPADEAARAYHRIAAKYPDRFVLGIGTGHPEADAAYVKPLDALNAYFDVLDEAGVPKERRALAALGPRVLKLAAERSAGAHPYLVNAEHTRRAREVLGEGPLLATEQKVVLGTDRAAARATANSTLGRYLGLSNYVTNLRRLGFEDEDFANGGSDRLFDELILTGDAEKVAAGLRAHLDAGATQVLVQPLGDDPLATLRTLAATLDLKK